MELVLTIIAGIGILLLLISYLTYVRSGFKHHFVTGLISTLPVLNIVTLPALWQKAGKRFLMGVLGLIILSASWFFGADKGLGNIVSKIKGDQHVVIIDSNTTISAPVTSQTSSTEESTPIAPSTASAPYSNTRQRFIDESEMESLPSKALYVMDFEAIPINQISSLNNRIVTIKTNSKVFEGRILSVNSSSVLIQSGGEQEIPIANILELRLMVKKAKP